MSSVRSILSFLRRGGKKAERVELKKVLNYLFLTSRTLGSLNFFLNGTIICTDAHGKPLRYKVKDHGIMSGSKKESLAGIINDIFAKKSSSEDQHPLHQQLEFKKSFMKLQEKATMLCEMHSNMPKPTISHRVEGDICYIEIPLLSNHSNKIYVTF